MEKQINNNFKIAHNKYKIKINKIKAFKNLNMNMIQILMEQYFIQLHLENQDNGKILIKQDK